MNLKEVDLQDYTHLSGIERVEQYEMQIDRCDGRLVELLELHDAVDDALKITFVKIEQRRKNLNAVIEQIAPHKDEPAYAYLEWLIDEYSIPLHNAVQEREHFEQLTDQLVDETKYFERRKTLLHYLLEQYIKAN